MASDLILGGVVIPGGSDFAFNYVSARTDRFRDWSHVANTPQGEWSSLPEWERNVITSRLRFLIRNNEYAAALASTFVTHIGNSTLRSKSQNRGYNDAKERLWLSYSERCELTGLSLTEVEDIILTELLVAGEVFILKLGSGQIQLIPSEWVFSDSKQTPENEIQGIAYDGKGVPTGYRVGYRDERGALKAGKSLVPTAQVLHVYKRERIEQLRGVPWLASSVPALQDISEITAAKVSSVKVQSFMAAAVVKNTPVNPLTLGDGLDATNKPSRYTSLKSATLLYLEPGEDIRTLQPNFQSSDFDAFLLSRLRAVGATIGMPIELFIEGYRDSNYSSARSTNIVWGRKVRAVRSLIERRFLEPLQLWTSERARAAGVLKGDRSLDGEASFGWPSIPSIDEQKEAAANAAKLAAGLTTYSAIYAEQNLYWEDEFTQRAREARFAAEVAAKEGVPASAVMPGAVAAPAPVPMANNPEQIKEAA